MLAALKSLTMGDVAGGDATSGDAGGQVRGGNQSFNIGGNPNARMAMSSATAIGTSPVFMLAVVGALVAVLYLRKK